MNMSKAVIDVAAGVHSLPQYPAAANVYEWAAPLVSWSSNISSGTFADMI
jgi:hypothetical protein